MNQVTDAQIQPLRAAAPTDTRTMRDLFVLGFNLAIGGVIVWQLRQEWAKEQTWLWMPFIAVMIFAAQSLRGLELWMPGQPILPRLAALPVERLRIIGITNIVAALALTGWMIWRLWPDYHKWRGTPLIWLIAIALMLLGAGLFGAVGKGSPRAATALTLWPDTRRNRQLEAIAFLLIFALAIFLRTYRIDSIPPGIYVDETNGGLDALYILEGRDVSPFGTGWYGTPNLYLYYMAEFFKTFGATWGSLKAISLIPAILTVPAVYMLGRLMFGPMAGLMAMLLMAVSRWHLSMSRWGWNETAPPLFQVLATFFLIRGLRDRRALDYAISGALAGLSVYTYLSARLAVATILLYVLYWLISDPSGLRASLRRSWAGLGLMVLAALVVVAPIGITYITDPFTFKNRVAEISVFRDIKNQGTLAPLTQNIGDILKFFHQTGDHQGKHNLPDEPMTDPITGLLFAVGFAYAILGWRDQRRVLLLLWLALGLAGSVFSSQHESPQSYRALTAVPAVVFMAADVLDRVVRSIYRALDDHQYSATRQYLPLLAAGGFAVLTLGGATLWESNVYFGRQASSPEVMRGFNSTENSIARETISALQSNKEVYLSPRFSTYSPLRFLLYGVMKAKTGKNTLDNAPYHVILPEVGLPLPDTGNDVLILLDSDYWSLRDYIASFYPKAQMELIQLEDGSPVYMRIEAPRAQVSNLQGLVKRVAHPDGHQEEHVVADVKLEASDAQANEVTWEGAIQIEHGGEYDLRGEDGLQVFLDDLPWQGKNYLGRGLYHLHLIWRGGSGDHPRLMWQAPDHDPVPMPANVLFHITGTQHGLLGRYWRNNNWEGPPVFHQVTPFLLLAWPDEQPLVPNGEFTARYSGTLHITRPGVYLLRLEADDGARLILDGSILGEGMIPGQPNTFEIEVDLPAGDHPIQIDYFQQGGGTALRFFWRYGDEPLTPVPPSALFPAQP